MCVMVCRFSSTVNSFTALSMMALMSTTWKRHYVSARETNILIENNLSCLLDYIKGLFKMGLEGL